MLIENGVDVHARNSSGTTAIFVACMYAHMDILELLLEYGADINEKRNDTLSCLAIACYFTRVEVVRELIKRGVDVDAGSPPPIVTSCLSIKEADEKDIDVNGFQTRRLEIAKLLLEAGAKLTRVCDAMGCSPLLLARMHGLEEVVKLIETTWTGRGETTYELYLPDGTAIGRLGF